MTEKEYDKAIEKINSFKDKEKTQSEVEELVQLLTEVEHYELKHKPKPKK